MARFIILTLKKLNPFTAIKHFLPKTLFGRSLVILITPIILVQLITGYVFWDRHWAKHTERMADQICSNISSLLDMSHAIPNLPGQMAYIERFAKKHYGITMLRYSPFEPLTLDLVNDDSWRDRLIVDALSKKISYPFRVRILSNLIKVQVATTQGVFEFSLSKRILFSKSTPTVIWWEVGAPLFFILIAFIFMRNQMRPLQTLSSAVESLGKGREVAPIKPSGALEIRRVGRSFNEMRERIQRQISQRTEMLAGISHDLKTPLTRMELQLALLKQSTETRSLLVDVKEMEQLVEEYLAFARDEEGEIATEHNLYLLFQEVLQRFDESRIELSRIPDKLPCVTLRPHAFKRALKNLVSNSLRYGERLWIQLSASARTITLVLDDNGPGIPAGQREEVFRPFVRLDKSRNRQTGGYGLGLAITKDIITAHGGTILLDDSPQGGLRVVLNLPV